MSDAGSPPNPASANKPSATPGPTAAPAPDPNLAQEAFGKYRMRLAAQPMATPWDSPGWPPVPPSAMMPGASPQALPHPLGSLSVRLGSTLRLSVDLLNATLASAANALGGMDLRERRGHGCYEGCGRQDCCCDHDCCREMGIERCRPGVHGCGCGY